ncbi:MAG: hypothetical protein HXY25_11510 [Alphaproteobacteria bacterium]|nr:hypothetical protein [Alphaproteobacteria bacterium]
MRRTRAALAVAGVMTLGLSWAGPAAADSFMDVCLANASSGRGEAADNQYCSCLAANAAKSSTPDMKGKLEAALQLPRDERRAAIEAIPGGTEVVTPCVQQMRGG